MLGAGTVQAVAVDRETLGEVIRAARGNRSQREVAQEAGVGQDSISEIERATVAAKLETLERLAPALGLSLRELLARAGIIESELPVRDAIASDSSLKPGHRKLVLELYDEFSSSG